MADSSDYIDAISEEQDIPDAHPSTSHFGSKVSMKKQPSIAEQVSSSRAHLKNPELCDLGE